MPKPLLVRVVVRLPWDRPENPLVDPPLIDWNQEKADTLWKYIERSRSNDNVVPDWKSLAAHLEVPLPYLLYRVNARFQEEIRGLKDIKGSLGPTSSQPPSKPLEAIAYPEKSPTNNRALSHLNTSSRFTASPRLSTPLGVRARLNSLGSNSPRPKKATSSSTLTLQAQKRPPQAPLRPTTPSEGTDSEDEAVRQEEDADREAEEQEALDRKLKQLQEMMTSDALGLVSSTRSRSEGKGGGRTLSEPVSHRSSVVGNYKQGAFSSQNTSHSVSSASSPQGSIPDIPSPSSDSQPHSPNPRRLSYRPLSPPSVSPRHVLGQRHRPQADRTASERSSSHGSEASSFSDLSDASLSTSALESALMSNIRTGGSRLSQFRSRTSGR